MGEKNGFLAFWATLPGILTGIAGLIGAIALMIPIIFPDTGPNASEPTKECVVKSGEENSTINMLDLEVRVGEVKSNNDLESLSFRRDSGQPFLIENLAKDATYPIDFESQDGANGSYKVTVRRLVDNNFLNRRNPDVAEFEVCKTG